jgi:histidine triad (HIT) family protein
MDTCVFCRIIDKKLPSYIVDEDDSLIVFLSKENHPLIVPKRHIVDIFDLDDEIASQVMKKTVEIAKATKAAIDAEGIYITQANGAAGGQDVFHYHLHVYPKWADGRKPDTTPEARQKMMEKIQEKL